MIHHPTTRMSGHYASNVNGEKNSVLVQLQDGMEQVRVVLSKNEAEHLIDLIQGSIEKLDSSVPYPRESPLDLTES